MADRYWVGGTGTWDSTSTTNWSASSGGASGASVPTAADNVFFDANSNVGTGAFTCTMANTPRVCNDFTASGLDGVMTLAGASIGLTVSGSLTFQATNFTRTYTGTTTFNATTTGKTVTTNGVAFGTAIFDGVGGGWTLGSAFSCGANSITLINGTFDTSSLGNYAVSASGFGSTNSNVRTINLNASTVTVLGTTPITFTTSTNLTFNAGTSTINCSYASPTFAGGGLTYYNVSFTSTALIIPVITGVNTFNNLSITGRNTIGIGVLSLSANQTINGTFTVSAGTASAYRMQISSDTFNTTRTLTCAAVSLTDTDFRDITIAGAASPASGTRLGDCKGNSGITFPAAKTVYFRAVGSATWCTTGLGSWSATSGGAFDATQFPLAQDTAVFPAATYPASGSTTTINADYNIGTIDMSLRTSNTMTLATGVTNPNIYGNWINGTGITISGTGTLTFAGRNTQTITSSSVVFTQLISIISPSGIVQLQDALTTGTTSTTTLTRGTLDLQSFKLSTGLFSSSNSNTRTIAFGTGSIDCTGTGTVYTTLTATNLTCTGSKNVNITSTGSTAISVNPNASTVASLQNINFTGGTYTLSIGSGSNINNLNFTGYAGSYTPIAGGTINVYGNLTISTGMTLGSSTGIMQFFGTGTQTVTTNAKTFDFNITQNQTGSVQLQDAWTIGSTKTYTHTAGTLFLQTYTLTAGLFVSNSGATRAIAFGTGNITLNCSSAGLIVWDMYASSANFSYTGTPTVNISSALTSASALGFQPATSYSANTTLNFNFTSGSYFLYAPYGNGLTGTIGYIGAINFTGFSGILYLFGYLVVSRDLTLSSGMTLSFDSSSYYYFMYPQSGATANITTNGKTIPSFFYFSGVDSTANSNLLDAFTSSTSVQFYAAKLDLNGQTLTAPQVNATNIAFSLTFNGGTVAVTGASFTNTVALTTVAGTGTGTISMTSASAKTFAGGGATYNCTLNQGGAGALNITGSNTFDNITNSYNATGATSILFTAGTTTTFNNWNASGTVGNLLTIGSVTAASHTLSKSSGTVNANYLSISRSTATGGAGWYAGANSTDGGNNTGWLFSLAPLLITYGSRITNTGILYTPVSAYFDEVTMSKSSITPSVTYSSTFDEVTLQGLNISKRETSTGQIQVSGYLDEVTGIY